MSNAWVMRFDGPSDIMYLAKNGQIVHNINAAHVFTVMWHAQRKLSQHQDAFLRKAFKTAYPNEGIVNICKIKISIVPVEITVRQTHGQTIYY